MYLLFTRRQLRGESKSKAYGTNTTPILAEQSCVLVKKKKKNSVMLAGCTFCHVFCTIIITRSRRALFLVGKLFYRFDTVKDYYSVKLWSMLMFCAFVFWWECSLIPVMFFQPLWTKVIHFHFPFVNRINVMFRHFFYILGLWTLAKTTLCVSIH